MSVRDWAPTGVKPAPVMLLWAVGQRDYEDTCFRTARADLNADAFELFDEGLAADPECAGNM